MRAELTLSQQKAIANVYYQWGSEYEPSHPTITKALDTTGGFDCTDLIVVNGSYEYDYDADNLYQSLQLDHNSLSESEFVALIEMVQDWIEHLNSNIKIR